MTMVWSSASITYRSPPDYLPYMQLLLFDNYDSFTYNLYDYLLQTGVDCIVVRNDQMSLADMESLAFDAVVFSPGPKRPADAGLLMAAVARWHSRYPMLGVCLGHQAIGEYFGARLVRAPAPVHGKSSQAFHYGHWLFAGIPSPWSVMRYHSLLLASLQGTPLRVLAETEGGEIMALAHESLPLLGLQFHPESILTEHGLRIIHNWVAGLTQYGNTVQFH